VSQEQCTVLIVDDERSIRLSLRTSSRARGTWIVEAREEEEALSLARQRIRRSVLDIICRG